MEELEKKRKKRKNRAAGAAAGVLAAASLAVGSLFGSADDVLAIDGDEDSPEQQANVVSMGKRLETAAGQRANERVSLRDRLRAFLQKAPAVVRATVLLPLWALGQAGLGALSALFTALAPVWQVVLGVLLNALLLFLVVAVIYKLLFPNRSVKDLLKPKRFVWIAGGALFLALADMGLRLTYEDYRTVSGFVKLGLGFLVLLVLAAKLTGKRRVSASKAA